VAIGLSGGVDSSVAAALLRDEGHDVVAVTMAIYDGSFALEGSGKHACYGADEIEDIRSAAAVCKKIGIPLHVIDLKREFREHVIDYFRGEYLKGRTPNPCIVCNQRLKFDFLLEKAKMAGIDFDLFATGHYARTVETGGRFLLKRAKDLSKDQSYFLYALTPHQISRTVFPLGEYNKDQVRDIARSLGLETSDRPESQDFVAGGDYSPLFRKGEAKEGDIVDKEGVILGRHRGIIHYTVGQRRGIGLGSSRPLYVIDIDACKNRIVVGHREALYSRGLIASDLNLIAIDELEREYRVEVKIRLQHRETGARLFPHENNRARIVFDKPQISVTPGQSAVFYQGDNVLGGGIIERALSA